MKILALAFALFVAIPSAVAQAPALSPEQRAIRQQLQALQWQRGPTDGRIGEEATMRVPQGYFFLNDTDSSRLLQVMGNPPRTGQYAYGPEGLDWFAVFMFNPSGYVKDDEKVDADALLKVLKESDGPANEERKRLGLSQIFTDGWLVPPHYDIATKRLEWGVRLHGEDGEKVINYTSRLLGRSGVMSATLVSSPETIGADMETFRKQLAGFSFVQGKTYAEFRDGDKMAEYGLGALVVGGAAAAAAKSGLLKSAGKFIWVLILGALAGLGALWKRITGRKD